jgi:uncharacterized protein YoxC
VSSVLTTLGIVLIFWLISSVRSAQKQLKEYGEVIPELHRSIEQEINDVYKNLEKEIDEKSQQINEIQEDTNRKFDNSYRTMYEFRDWAKEQIERLIETDLQNK